MENKKNGGGINQGNKSSSSQVAMTDVPTTKAYMVLLRLEVVSSSLERNA